MSSAPPGTNSPGDGRVLVLSSSEFAGLVYAEESNVGPGIQFAAVGALAYRKAREAGLGVELPADLFVARKAPDELYAP